MTIRGTMKIRGGFFAILAFLCVMIAVIAVGTGPDTSSSTELASAESLVVGAGDEHDHAEGEDHEHADGADHTDGDHAHADGDHADGAHADGAHADGENHGHADGADHANGAHADGDHAHDPADPSHAEDPNHAHPTVPGEPAHPHPTVPGEPTHPHPPDPPAITYTQVQLDLVAATRQAINPRFANPQAAYDAGYRSIGDSVTGFEHYVHNGYLGTAEILNPATIESLVYQVGPGNTRTLASGMYILPPGQTLNNVPIAFDTPQTPWHIHTNLCWAVNPIRVVGITNNGQAGCPPNTIYFPTPPMLHVWIDEQPCGLFSDLEQVETGDCNAHPH